MMVSKASLKVRPFIKFDTCSAINIVCKVGSVSSSNAIKSKLGYSI